MQNYVFSMIYGKKSERKLFSNFFFQSSSCISTFLFIFGEDLKVRLPKSSRKGSNYAIQPYNP